MRERIRVMVPSTRPGLREELRAFVLYCIGRIDREVEADTWDVRVAVGAEFSIEVRAHVGGTSVAARSVGRDPVVATWNAMCQVEQPLREAVRHRAA